MLPYNKKMDFDPAVMQQHAIGHLVCYNSHRADYAYVEYYMQEQDGKQIKWVLLKRPGEDFPYGMIHNNFMSDEFVFIPGFTYVPFV